MRDILHVGVRRLGKFYSPTIRMHIGIRRAKGTGNWEVLDVAGKWIPATRVSDLRRERTRGELL